MYKIIVYIFAVLFVYTNCSSPKKFGGEKKDDIVTIRYMRWANPAELASTRELIKMFEKKHPNIKVNFTTESWRGYWNKLQTMFAANEAPDVFLMSVYYLYEFYHKGLLLNLQPMLNEDKDIDLSDFFEPPMSVYKFKKNLYALPRDINTIVLYYNKDIFDRAGVPYPDKNWSWQDIIKYGKKLTVDLNGDGRIDQWGFYVNTSFESCWGNFIYQNKGKIIDMKNKKCVINSDAGTEAINFLYSLMKIYKIAPSFSSQNSLGKEEVFSTGKIAMLPAGTWKIGVYKKIKNFKWDITYLPKGKIRANLVNGVANAINNKTKYKKAAWELVKFLSGKEAQIAVAKSGTSIPIRKSIAYSAYYLDGIPKNKKICLATIKYGKNYPLAPMINKWLDNVIKSELEACFIGVKSVNESLAISAKKSDEILKSWREMYGN